jgi:(p)ppGpp synthase/HD superfamily hydrolase
MRNDDLIDNIKDLAYVWHDGQYRRGPGSVPYIEHPKAVVEKLRDWGINNEIVIAAAWGHDLLEDTDVNEKDIIDCADVESKGLELLRLIKKFTYDPTRWASKGDWLKHIAENESLYVMYVKAADRYCNTKDFCKAGRYKKAKSYLLDAWPIIEKVSHKNSNVRNDFKELLDEIENSL